MSNKNTNKYDLKERTKSFGINLIIALRKIRMTTFNKNSISQCIRSGTSIGANYFEADGAESRKDFEHKIGICKKEAQETEYWLSLIIETCGERNLLENLLEESVGLRKIFSASINTSRREKIDSPYISH